MKKKRNILLLLLVLGVLSMACGLASDGVEGLMTDPDLDLSGLVLTPADFPNVGFTDVPMEEIGISLDDLSSEEFSVESFFALLEPNNFQMVLGLTSQVSGPVQKAGFDLVLSQPELVLESFLGGMGEIDVSQTEELPEFADTVGDSSAGMTVVANVEGVDMRMDVLVFRNKSVGSFLVVMYLDGQTPPVTLMDVATTFNGKVETLLASQ